MITKSLQDFKSLIKDRIRQNTPIKIHINTKQEACELEKFLAEYDILTINTIDSQLKEYLEVHTRFHKGSEESFRELKQKIKDTDTDISGNLVYLGWGEKAVFNILDSDKTYDLLTWRNKEKITTEEQEIISNARVGIIGASVGSFTCRVLAKLGFKNLNIAEIKEMKPSNAPRMYQDSLRNYSRHKLSPLIEALYEFNPYINLTPYFNGVTEANIEEFLHIDGNKIDVLVDAADDGKIKILMRQLCSEYGIPLVTGFDEKGALIIERYDKPELLIEPKVTHTIKELEELKKSSPQEYVYKLLDFFPGGMDNISQRQKETLTGINNKSRGGFSQLSWEASLFASYVSKSVLDILLKKEIHGVRFFDLDKLITEEMSKNLPYKI